jgi:hypothetical protein
LVLIIFSLSIFVLIKIINDRFFSFEAGWSFWLFVQPGS